MTRDYSTCLPYPVVNYDYMYLPNSSVVRFALSVICILTVGLGALALETPVSGSLLRFRLSDRRTEVSSDFVRSVPAVQHQAAENGAVALSYHLIDLCTINTDPVTGQISSSPARINQSGVVAGTSRSGTSLHAARFTSGVVDDLGVIPGGLISSGVGINDSGVVTGDSEYSPDGGAIRHATLFKNGTATDLGFLPQSGNYSRGTGVNNSEVVVGFSGFKLSTSNTRAFIWDAANGMRDIGTLGGGWAKAFDINDANQVTGTSQVPTGLGAFQAFFWDEANGMRPIPTIAGDSSSGNAINANGHVVGTSTINAFDNREHAFLWDGRTTWDLGALGGDDFYSDRSYGAGINIHDHVVGGTYRPYSGGALYAIPFLYRDGKMYDLSTLVDASGVDYRLGAATSINDAGQIAVNAVKISTNETRAVLLSPNVTLSGLVVTPQGRGLRNVAVTLTDPNGVRLVVMTSTLGFFQFENMVAGQKYTVGAVSRRYRFASRELDVTGSLTDMNLVGQE